MVADVRLEASVETVCGVCGREEVGSELMSGAM